jgi:hypothetical protein
MSKTFIESKAQEIIDHFFTCGARVSKKDYDFVVQSITSQKAEIIKAIPPEVEPIPENEGSDADYANGYKDARTEIIKVIEEEEITLTSNK